MLQLIPREISARIRALVLRSSDSPDYAALALGLDVDEAALRLSIDDEAPLPTMEVLEAVIRTYGVDPTWLLFGEYSDATHRTTADASAHVTRMLLTKLTPPSRPRVTEQAPNAGPPPQPPSSA